MRKITISGGRIIDPANKIDQIGDLYISEGKIASVLNKPDGFSADIAIDAKDQIVCPGFIDLCARLRDPGQTHKANIASETKAAAHAGITTLCNPPDTIPITDTSAVTELILDKAEKIGKAQVLPIGALTRQLEGKVLSNMSSLHKAGCIAFSNARHPITNTLVMRRAMEYAATHDLLVIIRPEDPWLANQGCAHEGEIATRFGLPGIPETAELIAISQHLALAELTGCRIHFGQLSCARSVELIAEAKANQLPVSADVAIHQLFFSEHDIPVFDSNYHVIPPYRTEADKQGLRQGLISGTIDAICSDHQPHDIDAKLGAFPETEPGIASLESILPLTLNLVSEKIISLSQAITLLTCQPANIINHSGGKFSEGTNADVCVFDPEQHWTVDNNNWLSLGENTPFWGQQLQGRVTHTLHNGKIVYNLNN